VAYVTRLGSATYPNTAIKEKSSGDGQRKELNNQLNSVGKNRERGSDELEVYLQGAYRNLRF
jgi:hypothetical protein